MAGRCNVHSDHVTDRVVLLPVVEFCFKGEVVSLTTVGSCERASDVLVDPLTYILTQHPHPPQLSTGKMSK